MTTWRFDTEFSLEEFIWASLEPLLSLKPLARQYSTEGQICDILATTLDRQLVVLELKNVEDRYVVPQLTRYYSSLSKEQPFAGNVDYSLPIRLIAIAPAFHAHNYIDREHSRLDFEFWIFEVTEVKDRKIFCIKPLGADKTTTVDISPLFQKSLHLAEKVMPESEAVQIIGRPPKSFRNLLEALESERHEYLLSLRRQILEFDERMSEVGLSKRTQYGLIRGGKGIPDNKVCAEFLPNFISERPNLFLMLPYPKGGVQRLKNHEPVFGKKYALAKVPLFEEDWEKPMISFFLGKSRRTPSGGYVFSIKLYTYLCNKLLDDKISLLTTQSLVNLALREWQVNHL